MVRIKQFADDLAISKKQAKDLINKGRNRRDGGSQILEKTMSDTEKKKKKKTAKKKDVIGGRTKKDFGISPSPMPPFIKGGRSRRDYDEPDVPPMAPMTPFRDYGDPRLMSDGGSNVTKVNTDKLTKAQMGQFKNIVNASTSGKITPAEAQRKIRKMLTLNKKDGGAFPDLTGDGKVTKKDILRGRGVPGFSRGGGIAIQGLGFKGVR
jgi:hypothetical protein|tara:strand:- start:495 stop:1118 length:624 start_codon:yes stop_codon:yes gene_type:complete